MFQVYSGTPNPKRWECWNPMLVDPITLEDAIAVAKAFKVIWPNKEFAVSPKFGQGWNFRTDTK